MSGQDFDGREIFIDTAQERSGGGGGGSFGGGAGGGGFERPPRSESYSIPDSARQATNSLHVCASRQLAIRALTCTMLVRSGPWDKMGHCLQLQHPRCRLFASGGFKMECCIVQGLVC